MVKHLLEGHSDLSPVGLGVWVNVASLLCLPLDNRLCLRFGLNPIASDYLALILMPAVPAALYCLVRRRYPIFARGLKFGMIGLGVLGILMAVGLALILALISDSGFI